MVKRKQLLRLILLFGLASLLVISAESFRAQEPEDPRAGALNRLRKDSAQPPTIHFEASIPHFVSVHVPVPSNTPDDPVIRALDFLEKYRDLYLSFGSPGPNSSSITSLGTNLGNMSSLGSVEMRCQSLQRRSPFI